MYFTGDSENVPQWLGNILHAFKTDPGPHSKVVLWIYRALKDD
jgi:hypothetical protein